MPATGLVHVFIDRLAADHGEGPWLPEITAAREEYAQVTGRLFEDDGDLYEQRTAAFLEWYVAERPLREGGACPALATLSGQSASLSVEDRAALAAIAVSHRSVFEIMGVAPGMVDLLDLIDGARFTVRERRSTAGFHQGDVLETRLFWTGEAVSFSKTFLFHPTEAAEEIKAIIEAARAHGETRPEIVGRLARTQLRWHRQRDTAAARLYKEAASRVGRISEVRSAVADDEHR